MPRSRAQGCQCHVWVWKVVVITPSYEGVHQVFYVFCFDLRLPP